jgi:hypothetical protein
VIRPASRLDSFTAVRAWLAAIWLITAWAACPDATAQGRPEPLGYEGFALGGRIEEFRRRFPDFRCDASACVFDADSCIDLTKPPSEIEPCRRRNTFGAVTPVSVRTAFRSGVLVSIDVEFVPSAFDWLAEGLAGRHGRPTTSWEDIVREPDGATRENRVRVWRRAEGVLEVRRYGERVDRGVASFRAAP